ncbi:hypothetical protein EOM82_04090 [bacterium]|nr:hypothetical protein [bacterium]
MTKSKKIIIALSIVSILIMAGLATALGIFVTRNNKAQATVNTIYEKSFRESLDSISDIELRLSKINVLTGTALRQQLLSDVWRQCDIAYTNLSQLGQVNEETNTVIKFLNQMGDYCYYLSMKLKTSQLSEEETANLTKFYDITKELSASLREVEDKLVTGKKIETKLLSESAAISDAIKTHSSVDYPELIYDGPFSDALNDREVKSLKDAEEITSEQGAAKIAEFFPDAKNVSYIGEGTTSIDAYLYQFDINGQVSNAQITKKGGLVASYNSYCAVDDPTLSEEECIAKGEEYMTKLGYQNMKAVWVFNNNSTVYINFAYLDENEIVYYPDLVKIKINSNNGDLIGVEAENYLYNHISRSISLGSEKTIILNKNLNVVSQVYCLIPTEWNTEILCKEVVATANGITYYIYFDMTTGEEIKAMVVIEDEGKLLA